MNKIFYILSALLILSFAECTKVEKNVHNYYPEVKTTDVTILPDGTVKVSGEIISQGNTPLVLIGFCMDTIPSPDVLSNQQNVTELYGNTFTTIYKSLSSVHKYYFKAWAANENEYAVGEVLSIDSITMSDDNIPCKLPLDTLTLNSNTGLKNQKYTQIGPINTGTLEWRIDMETDFHSPSISFGQSPINGVYQTTENSTPEKGYSTTITMDGYQAKAKANVYVKQLIVKLLRLPFVMRIFSMV